MGSGLGVNWTVCLRIGGGDKNLSSFMESGGGIGLSMMSRTTGWELRQRATNPVGNVLGKQGVWRGHKWTVGWLGSFLIPVGGV